MQIHVTFMGVLQLNGIPSVLQFEIKLYVTIKSYCIKSLIKQKTLLLYIFFWVFPRRQIVVGRRFGTMYQFHLQRLGVQCTLYT